MQKKQKRAMKKLSFVIAIALGSNCWGVIIWDNTIVLGGNCPGTVVLGGNCPGGNCPT